MKAVEQYLTLYAEPEVKLLTDIPLAQLEYCLIIPAFDEPIDFFNRLSPLLHQQALLLIVVINQPDSLPEPTDVNLKLLESLNHQTRLVWQNQHLQLRQPPNCPSPILIVDRFNKGSKIPVKKGVGLARKIAADIAATLIHKGTIKTPWLYTTDCDVRLPKNYFQHPPVANNTAALVFPFKHIISDDALGEATRLYEFSLHYYCAGLNYANSPYAFHTIGSTLAADAKAYCQARGFPQKSGGEDFYLLNKLAKIGPIVSLQNPVIQIEARTSHRVPFGTGPAVESIMAINSPKQNFTVYNPQVFEHLKQLLELFPAFFQQNTEQTLSKLPPIAQQVVVGMGIIQAIEQANKLSLSSNSQQQFLRHLNGWFDGFRTLKFIHGLRDNGLNNIKAAELTITPTPWIADIAHYNAVLPKINSETIK